LYFLRFSRYKTIVKACPLSSSGDVHLRRLDNQFLDFYDFYDFVLLICFAIMDVKETTIGQMENDHSSHSSDLGEKGAAPVNAYPMSDEDYVVTFKTWIVVTVLASAYGVCTFNFNTES
jgi:hypothetical protein